MCVFCKIINKEIPSYTVYEDDSFLAFLDLSQATIGHTLVIPKVHTPNLLEIPQEVATNIFSVVQTLTKQMSVSLNTTNFNVINNCGRGAGQTVDHFHIHILPRYQNDSLKIEFTPSSLSSEEMQRIQKRILGN